MADSGNPTVVMRLAKRVREIEGEDAGFPKNEQWAQVRRARRSAPIGRAVITGSAEHLEALLTGWQPVSVDGLVTTDQHGNILVRQITHLEKRLDLIEEARKLLKAEGIDLEQEDEWIAKLQ